MDDPSVDDFLAREKEILGADAALFGNPLTTGPSIDDQVLQDIDKLVPGLDAMSGQVGIEPIPVMDPIQPNVFISAQAQPLVQAFESQVIQDVEQIPTEPEPLPPSQAILDWQVEFEKQVVERDQKEKDKHERMLVEAREQLDRFYAEYTEKKNKGIQRSKDLEKQTLASLNPTSQNVWERVGKYIEVPPKTKTDSTTGTGPAKKDKKDEKPKKSETTRFKQVLNDLKNDPKAPGVTA